MNNTEIMTTHGVGRPLSEAQRSHLTGLIAAMNVAQIRLEAAQKVAAAQQDAAQAAYDGAQATAQAFLNYCGQELGCTFSDGDWQFDQAIMAFVRVEIPPRDDAVTHLDTQAVGAVIHENGKLT
jgi:multidrug efflux pump subunit AcrA (membrane-fusion protein)